MNIVLRSYNGKEHEFKIPALDTIKRLVYQDISGDDVVTLHADKVYYFDTGDDRVLHYINDMETIDTTDKGEISFWMYEHIKLSELLLVDVHPVTIIIGPDHIGKTRLCEELAKREDIWYCNNPASDKWPKTQADEAIYLLDQMHEMHNNTNLLIETNSPFMIRKFQALIAEKYNGMTHDMFQLYYMDRMEDGMPYLIPYEFDRYGKLSDRLENHEEFFGLEFELSMELMRANNYDEGDD